MGRLIYGTRERTYYHDEGEAEWMENKLGDTVDELYLR